MTWIWPAIAAALTTTGIVATAAGIALDRYTRLSGGTLMTAATSVSAMTAVAVSASMTLSAALIASLLRRSSAATFFLFDRYPFSLPLFFGRRFRTRVAVDGQFDLAQYLRAFQLFSLDILNDRRNFRLFT